MTSPSSESPTGTVSFKDGSNKLGSAPLVGGVATYVATNLKAGSNSLTAVYFASDGLSGSTSSILSQTVVQATSSLTVNSSQNPSVFGQPISFTATIAPQFSGSPTGKIKFQNSGTTIGAVPLAGGMATFVTSLLGVGTDSVTAVYDGTLAFSGSTSTPVPQVVGQATSSLALTASSNPSVSGQPVTFTAIVTPAFNGTPTGKVTFKSGTSTLGTVTLTGGVANYVDSSLSAGTFTVAANYFGGKQFGASSAMLTQTVILLPTYSLMATPLSPGFIASGGTAVSTIAVTAANGYAGSVNLSCSMISGVAPPPACSFNRTLVLIGGGNPGTATLTTSTSGDAPPGTYSIAVTGSDANGLAPSNGSPLLALITVPANLVTYGLTAASLAPSVVTSGGATTSLITVTPVNGYTGSVNLSCSPISGGAPVPSCSFNPTLVTISGNNPVTATLTVSTSITTPAGNYDFTVTGSDANGMAPTDGVQALSLSTSSVIQHVVIIFQENRSTDNLFQDPVLISRGADIASSGLNSFGQTIPLTPIDLGTNGSNPETYGLDHSHGGFLTMYDGGKMDGANRLSCIPATKCPVNPAYR